MRGRQCQSDGIENKRKPFSDAPKSFLNRGGDRAPPSIQRLQFRHGGRRSVAAGTVLATLVENFTYFRSDRLLIQGLIGVVKQVFNLFFRT